MRLKPQTYALTAVTHARLPLFRHDNIATLFIETLFRYRDDGKFKLHAFVVMPEHIHVLLTPAGDMAIERCAQLLKGGFSFAIRKEVPGKIWQEGYYAHRVTDDDDQRAQTLYIASNPSKRRLNPYPHVHTSTVYQPRLDA